MSIQFEHAIELPQSPERVFALLDDLPQTPKWLARCVALEKLAPGENMVGQKLRYTYREGGRTATMEGEITARVPNERLTCGYQDAMMDVVVDFRVSRAGVGTSLTHVITITPKTFMARLFSSLIRKQLPNQTVTAMETLRVLLATDPGRDAAQAERPLAGSAAGR